MEIKWIIYALAIIFVIAIVQKGFDAVKENPLSEGLDTAKTTAESIIDIGKDITGKGEVVDGTLVLGRIPCITNADCDAFEQCSGTCICDVASGECYKQ